jgi:hypothetical protein
VVSWVCGSRRPVITISCSAQEYGYLFSPEMSKYYAWRAM